jgi:haloalkane dehalogenase
VISGAFAFQKQRAEILGHTMAYADVGQGAPIVLLHGNPTSSYLWRNIIPYLQGLGRCIAPDLIGMGDSAKLPSSGPASYTFVEHRRYLDGLLDRLGVSERVTFVIHDWGSALGFDWANRHRESVKGLAYMEALVQPLTWDGFRKEMRPVFEALRSPAGEQNGARAGHVCRANAASRDAAPAQRRGDDGIPPPIRRARRRPAANTDVAAADTNRRRAC